MPQCCAAAHLAASVAPAVVIQDLHQVRDTHGRHHVKQRHLCACLVRVHGHTHTHGMGARVSAAAGHEARGVGALAAVCIRGGCTSGSVWGWACGRHTGCQCAVGHITTHPHPRLAGPQLHGNLLQHTCECCVCAVMCGCGVVRWRCAREQQAHASRPRCPSVSAAQAFEPRRTCHVRLPNARPAARHLQAGRLQAGQGRGQRGTAALVPLAPVAAAAHPRWLSPQHAQQRRAHTCGPSCVASAWLILKPGTAFMSRRKRCQPAMSTYTSRPARFGPLRRTQACGRAAGAARCAPPPPFLPPPFPRAHHGARAARQRGTHQC
jgi:hypothetical protein